MPDSLTKEQKMLKNLSSATTNVVYAEVMLSLGGDDSDKKLISRLYKEAVCRLSTKNLDMILDTHNKKLMLREQETLDAIENELLRRHLLEDNA